MKSMPLACVMLLTPLLCGCGGETDTAVQVTPTPSSTQASPAPANPTTNTGDATAAEASLPDTIIASPIPAAISTGKVEFRVGEGEEVNSFKPKGPDAVKFYDAVGNELCKLTFTKGRIKAKTADDKPLFELKPKDSKVMLKDASGENELFKFKIKGQNIDFYAPGDKRLYRIRKKDYGYALEDNNDKTLCRAKVKEGRIVLRDPNDKTILYSNDLKQPLALVFFFMKELSPEQQAGCSLFFLANTPR